MPHRALFEWVAPTTASPARRFFERVALSAFGLFMVLGLLSVLWSSWPRSAPVRIQSPLLTDKKVYAPGEWMVLHYAGHVQTPDVMGLTLESLQRLSDDAAVPLPVGGRALYEVGEQTLLTMRRVPEALPPGRYMLHGRVYYWFDDRRTRSIAYQSEPFEVK